MWINISPREQLRSDRSIEARVRGSKVVLTYSKQCFHWHTCQQRTPNCTLEAELQESPKRSESAASEILNIIQSDVVISSRSCMTMFRSVMMDHANPLFIACYRIASIRYFINRQINHPSLEFVSCCNGKDTCQKRPSRRRIEVEKCMNRHNLGDDSSFQRNNSGSWNTEIINCNNRLSWKQWHWK